MYDTEKGRVVEDADPYERKICVDDVGEGLAPPVTPDTRPTQTGGDKPRPYGLLPLS